MTTTISIANGGFALNGTPTYAGRSWKGHRIEGLLFNSRMANAIADDENPATRGAWSYADGDWDAERSTREFIAALPAYRAHGLLAVCLNIQGGSPQGYSWHQPWKIGGFTADGTIKPAWAARLDKVIKACDGLGMAVILGLFYGKQSGTLTDEAAVKAAVTNTVDWLLRHERRPTCCSRSATRSTCRTCWPIPSSPPQRCHELIELAKKRSQGKLLVSTSLITIDAPPEAILAAADFLLPHGNRVSGPDGPPQPSPHGIRLQVARWRAGAGLSRPADRLQRGRPFRLRQARQPSRRRRRQRRELGLLRLPPHPRALRGRLPVPAGRLDDLVGAQARLLRAAEGNHRRLAASTTRDWRFPAGPGIALCGQAPSRVTIWNSHDIREPRSSVLTFAAIALDQ